MTPDDSLRTLRIIWMAMVGGVPYTVLMLRRRMVAATPAEARMLMARPSREEAGV